MPSFVEFMKGRTHDAPEDAREWRARYEALSGKCTAVEGRAHRYQLALLQIESLAVSLEPKEACRQIVAEARIALQGG